MGTVIKGDTIEDIKYESITALKDKLKQLDTKWVDKLADKWYIAEAKITAEEFEQIKDTLGDSLTKIQKKIRNIAAGLVTHNTMRRCFLIYGDILLKEILKEHGQALGIAKKLEV